jgi:hypothetical protein
MRKQRRGLPRSVALNGLRGSVPGARNEADGRDGRIGENAVFRALRSDQENDAPPAIGSNFSDAARWSKTVSRPHLRRTPNPGLRATLNSARHNSSNNSRASLVDTNVAVDFVVAAAAAAVRAVLGPRRLHRRPPRVK